MSGPDRPTHAPASRAHRRPPIVTAEDALRHSMPTLTQPPLVQAWKEANMANVARGLEDLVRDAKPVGRLWARIVRPDTPPVDLGLVSLRVVTTAGVNFIVDAWQGTVELETMRYHAIGSGSTAEAVGNTALAAEFTTQYTVNSTRPTGTLAEGGTANTFRTVATTSVDAAAAVTEWGLFSQAAAPGGVMFDRAVFAVLNLIAGEGIEWDYSVTLPAGG